MNEPTTQRPQSSELRFVFKYPIDLHTMSAQHAIPEGSFFLDLQVQNDVPVMWWSVPHRAGEPANWPLRTFEVVPTGGVGYEARLNYVGTFQMSAFVGHVFAHERFDRA